MKIRQATASDSLLLSRLCMDVQRLHAEHHPDVFVMPQSEDFATTFFEEMLTDSTVRIYIAEGDGEAVGYIFFKLMERSPNPFTFAARWLHVDQISVRPGARRHGVGLALMQQAERLAKEWDVQRIQLDSWDFNIHAHMFFERLGYQRFNFRFWRRL